MDNVFILNENGTDAARSGLLRLHDAVVRREPGRPEAVLSPDKLLSRFRAADPTRNAACLPWLLRTYAAGGYRLEDLSKAHDTLAAFARLRGLLPNMAIIDGETRNPRKLGSHLTLASLWKVVAPLVEAERLAQEDCSGEQPDTDRERALAQSRVLHRSNRMVMAVPMTREASCWWGQGTQWCTAARKSNAFDEYHMDAPLIVICLRKIGDLPARKLQLYVHDGDIQFMDENDEGVSLELISERWQDFEALLYWAVGRNMRVLDYIPDSLLTEALCLTAVKQNGAALGFIPDSLRTEVICTAAVEQYGLALAYVPEPLRTQALFLVAVKSSGRALEDVPEPLRTEVLCSAAVSRDGLALEYVPEPLRTEAICSTAVTNYGQALKYVPEPLRTEAMCTVAVGSDGWALKYVPEPLRTEAICLAAVIQYGRALEYVPEHLRTEVMCLTSVTRGCMLYYIPEHLRTEALCLDAVSRDGLALEYVPEPLRTEAMCTTAVGRDGSALEYVPEPLRTKAICTVAVIRDGIALEYVPEHLLTEAICLAAVTQYGYALDYVPEPLRVEILRLIAVDNDKQESVSVTDETNVPKSYDLILESLEDCLNKLHPNHQNAAFYTNSGMG